MDFQGMAQRMYSHTPNLPNSYEASPQKLNQFKNGQPKYKPAPKAYPDSAIIQPRVLYNVTSSEDRYLPSPSYFTCIQTEVQPYMRKILVTWMHEVCEELQRRKDVFQLAVNYLDRFLSTINTPKSHLQLLGASCMLLASKFKEAHPVSSEILCVYTDNSVKLPDLLNWEFVVANVLSWDLAAPTSCYILDMLTTLHPLMQCLRDNGNLSEIIKTSAQQILDKCTLEYTFASHPPSMMASASLCLSYITHCQQVFWNFDDSYLTPFINGIIALTGIESDVLRNLMTVIGRNIFGNANATPSTATTSIEVNCLTPQTPQCTHNNTLCCSGQQLTPRDHDYHITTSSNTYTPESSWCATCYSNYWKNQQNGGINTSDITFKKIAEIYPTPPPMEKFYKQQGAVGCGITTNYVSTPQFVDNYICSDIPQTVPSSSYTYF